MNQNFNKNFITYYSENTIINDYILNKKMNFKPFFPDKLIYCGIDIVNTNRNNLDNSITKLIWIANAAIYFMTRLC